MKSGILKLRFKVNLFGTAGVEKPLHSLDAVVDQLQELRLAEKLELCFSAFLNLTGHTPLPSEEFDHPDDVQNCSMSA